MENLLSAITLAKNYGIPDIDNTLFSDFNNWTTPQPLGTHIIFKNAGIIKVDTTLSTSLLIDTPNISVDPALGNLITLHFTIDYSSSVNGIIYVGAVDSGGHTPFTAVPSTVITSGSPHTQAFSVQFNTSGLSFVKLRFLMAPVSSAYAEFDIRLASITAGGTPFANFNTGDRIISYWDDVAGAIKVYREDNPGGVATLITSGPDLGQLVDSQFTNFHFIPDTISGRPNLAIKISNYAFCTGNDKHEFRSTNNNPAFPYWTETIEENSAYCVINPDPDDPPVVCDIYFDEQPEILAYPSSQFSNDGSFRVHAASSHEDIDNPIKYTTNNEGNNGNYYYMSNTDGIVTFATVGTYTVYAVDKYNCKKSIQVRLLVDPSVYGPLYRQEYKDIQHLITGRFDISQSQYSGPINEEISDGAAPMILNKPSGDINNKFEVLRETNAVVSLVSVNNFRFIGLFSQDDRKFLGIYYKPVGTEIWRGFEIPSAWNESYVSAPYAVNISFVDGLSTLKDIDFLDDNGNRVIGDKSLIGIIALILNKLSLNLGIKSAINKFDIGHSSGVNDDPLDQTFINSLAFYDDDLTPMKCDEVLEAILKPFGAEIIQYSGWWNIVETDSKTAAYTYRTFTKDGVKINSGNGTYDPLVSVVSPNSEDGVLFADSNHTLEIIPAYGKLKIIHQLRLKESLIPISLDELWQINIANIKGGSVSFYSTGTSSKSIVDNSVVVTDSTSLIKGIKATQLDVLGVDDLSLHGGSVDIISPIFSITSKTDSISVEFSYKHVLDFTNDNLRFYPDPPWIRIDWQLRIVVSGVTFYYTQTPPNPWIVDGVFNPIYVTDYKDQFSTFSKSFDLPEFDPSSLITIQLIIRVNGAQYNDYLNRDSLRSRSTINLPIGTKLRGINLFGTVPEYVELTNGNPSEDSPTTGYVINPDDHDDTTNNVFWAVMQYSYFDYSVDPPDSNFNFYSFTTPLQSVSLEKPILKFYPNKLNPVSVETITNVINDSYKENLEISLIAGDHPGNIVQKELYLNYFKLANGTPTSSWHRKDFSEATNVQQILMKNLVNQYSKPTWKLSGSFLALVPWGFLNTIKLINEPADISVEDSDFNDFDTVDSKWVNIGIGEFWIDGTGGKPQVDFNTQSEDSGYLVTLNGVTIQAGTRINIDLSFSRINSDTAAQRLDRFVIGLFRNGELVQKVTGFDGLNYDVDVAKTIKFNTIVDADNIGFFIENIDGMAGTCSYLMDYFRLKGLTVIRYFAINSLAINERHNNREAELYQLMPAKISTDPDVDDTGGGETDPGDGSGGNGGNSYNGDYNNDYSGDFDTVLN